MDAVFKALADGSRRKLLDELHKNNGQPLTQLCGHLDMTRQAVTKHLRVLEGVGIVHSARAGRESIYKFDPQPIEELKQYLDLVSKQWDDALDRLKSFVES